MSMFVNGLLVASAPLHPSFVGNTTFQLGIWQATGTYYTGLLDEVKIFRSALDPATIALIFNSMVPDTFYPTNGPNGAPCVNGIPVDAVPFDGQFTCACDASYTDANCQIAAPWAMYTFERNLADAIGTSTGACVPVSCPTYAVGINGYGAVFDGANDFMNIPGPIIMGVYNSSFTVTAWLKFNSLAASGDTTVLSSTGLSVNSQSLHLTARNGNLYMGFWNNDFASTLAVPIGTWIHVAYRYSWTAQQQSIAMNGVVQSNTNINPPYIGTTDLQVGAWRNGAYFNGTMDNLQFFKGAASNAQIRQIYESTMPDTLNPYYGPNNIDCLNGGVRVDTYPLDKMYTCDCSTTAYIGKLIFPFRSVSICHHN
jgi:hypothetical protein